MNKNAISRIATIAPAGALMAGCAAPQNPDPRDPLQAGCPGLYLRHAAASAQLRAQHLQQRRRPLVRRQQLPAGPRPRLRQHAGPLPVQHHDGRGRLLRRGRGQRRAQDPQ
ncbi:hypothetical protein G6F68_018468 [Rhizopus microsporus]|nr:hypothetical protein G6F68_018468 [Rhizopus microsporus]